MKIYHKKGLEILNQRTIYLDLTFNKAVEELPMLCRWFFKYYETGTWNTMFGKGEVVDLPDIGICGVALNIWFEKMKLNNRNYEDSFDHLLSLNQLLIEIEEYKIKSEVWHKQGMIKIGMMSHWDIILLGVEQDNYDKVFVYGEGTGSNEIHFFKENIFDLFSDVTQYLSDEDLIYYSKGKVTGKNLYKNWGEDFWRIREDTDAV